jgi:thiol-disulfide isomerase/thioredoxin
MPLLPRKLTLAILVVALGFFSAGHSAFAFTLKDTTGHNHRLKDLHGKWVVVNFWATWCAPCIKEIPDLAAFAKAQGKKVRVLGVAMDWDETENVTVDTAKIKRFAKKAGHTYPLVLGGEDTPTVFGEIQGLPTTIVYNPQGKIVYRKTGSLTEATLNRVVAGEKVQ